MGKRRTEMKLIENHKARKKVYEERKKTMLKAAKELSILCDIKILLIIHEQDKQKSEIWPNDNQEAEQIIERFKQQRATKKAFHSFACKKMKFGNKFAISDHENMINHYSENQLRNLVLDLDAKIAAVDNAIQSKQVHTKVSGECQKTGFLNLGKEKEVAAIYQEPVNTHWPQQNFISYPEFDHGSCSRNITYVPLPVHPHLMQQPYMNANSLMDYYVPNIYTIPPSIYHPMMPGFPSQTNKFSNYGD